MRRATVFGLATLLLLLAVLAGYSAYWLIAAARIKEGVGAWAQSAHASKIEVSWRDLRVGGYPFAFRISLADATLRDAARRPSPVLHIPVLHGTARPWDFSVWRLAAPSGFEADLATGGERTQLKFTARGAEGTVMLGASHIARLWLALEKPVIEAGLAIRADRASAWLVLPPKPAQDHADPSLGLALDLHRVELPAPVRALGSGVDELAFGVTVKGALPAGDIVPAVSAWRDAGGTIELDNLRLEWGGIGASATGTIALDQDLQPIGGFSGAIEGYDRVLEALVQAGSLRARDAGLARLALAMLAKIGPDGRPQIATSFTIQNGEMFLGPAKLGRAPRIAWQ